MIGVGDLVVIVVGSEPGSDPTHGKALSKRGVYRVEALGCDYYGTPMLTIEGFHSLHPNGGYRADAFRKILPDEPTACEEEFQILLKLSKTRVSALGMVKP